MKKILPFLLALLTLPAFGQGHNPIQGFTSSDHSVTIGGTAAYPDLSVPTSSGAGATNAVRTIYSSGNAIGTQITQLDFQNIPASSNANRVTLAFGTAASNDAKAFQPATAEGTNLANHSSVNVTNVGATNAIVKTLLVNLSLSVSNAAAAILVTPASISFKADNELYEDSIGIEDDGTFVFHGDDNGADDPSIRIPFDTGQIQLAPGVGQNVIITNPPNVTGPTPQLEAYWGLTNQHGSGLDPLGTMTTVTSVTTGSVTKSNAIARTLQAGNTNFYNGLSQTNPFAVTGAPWVSNTFTSPDVVAHQGYTTMDGTNHYIFDTTSVSLRSNDAAWTRFASNVSITGTARAHGGAGVAYGSMVVSPIENYTNASVLGSGEQALLVLNASTLASNNLYDISAQHREVSAVAVVPELGVLFTTSYVTNPVASASLLTEYDSTTFAYLGDLSLSQPIELMQGIAWDSTHQLFWITTDSGFFYTADLSGHVECVFQNSLNGLGGSREGLAYWNGQLRQLIDNGVGDRKVWYFSLTNQASFAVDSEGHTSVNLGLTVWADNYWGLDTTALVLRNHLVADGHAARLGFDDNAAAFMNNYQYFGGGTPGDVTNKPALGILLHTASGQVQVRVAAARYGSYVFTSKDLLDTSLGSDWLFKASPAFTGTLSGPIVAATTSMSITATSPLLVLDEQGSQGGKISGRLSGVDQSFIQFHQSGTIELSDGTGGGLILDGNILKGNAAGNGLDGQYLSNINASAISGGTIPDARLSTILQRLAVGNGLNLTNYPILVTNYYGSSGTNGSYVFTNTLGVLWMSNYVATNISSSSVTGLASTNAVKQSAYTGTNSPVAGEFLYTDGYLSWWTNVLYAGITFTNPAFFPDATGSNQISLKSADAANRVSLGAYTGSGNSTTFTIDSTNLNGMKVLVGDVNHLASFELNPGGNAGGFPDNADVFLSHGDDYFYGNVHTLGSYYGDGANIVDLSASALSGQVPYGSFPSGSSGTILSNTGSAVVWVAPSPGASTNLFKQTTYITPETPGSVGLIVAGSDGTNHNVQTITNTTPILFIGGVNSASDIEATNTGGPQFARLTTNGNERVSGTNFSQYEIVSNVVTLGSFSNLNGTLGSTAAGALTAVTYYGDGSHLTGIPTNNASASVTNFVLNQVYSNGSGGMILVGSSVQLTVAGVAGQATMSLMVSNAGSAGYVMVSTNGVGTVITSIAMPYYQEMVGVVSNQSTYYFTNTSTGVGNSGSLVAGTGWYLLPSGNNSADAGNITTGTLNTNRLVADLLAFTQHMESVPTIQTNSGAATLTGFSSATAILPGGTDYGIHFSFTNNGSASATSGTIADVTFGKAFAYGRTPGVILMPYGSNSTVTINASKFICLTNLTTNGYRVIWGQTGQQNFNGNNVYDFVAITQIAP